MVPMRHLLSRAVALCVALDHPAYDCLYLAAAEARGHPFVTADERLCGKVRSAAFPVPWVLGLHAASGALRNQAGA